MIIWHQNNRAGFARNRVWYWPGQVLLHPRISVTSVAVGVDLMARIIEATDAVVTTLNGGGCAFSKVFTAERLYLPMFELKDMKVLHVSVVPRTIDMTLLSRGDTRFEFQIDIGIQQKLVDADDLSEIDDLMDFVEEIVDCIRANPTFGDTIWLRTENNPILETEHLAELRQFTSLLTLTLLLAS